MRNQPFQPSGVNLSALLRDVTVHFLFSTQGSIGYLRQMCYYEYHPAQCQNFELTICPSFSTLAARETLEFCDILHSVKWWCRKGALDRVSACAISALCQETCQFLWVSRHLRLRLIEAQITTESVNLWTAPSMSPIHLTGYRHHCPSSALLNKLYAAKSARTFLIRL